MFADPTAILKQFGITDTMHVADLGAGSGHYTKALAKLASQGKVYALEVQKEILERLKNDLAHSGITNVECMWANIEKARGTKLADGALDAAVLSNVLFQVEDPITTIREIKRILKSGGKVLVVDWSDSYGGMGPSAAAVISKEKGRTLFEQEGFTVEREIDAGVHHWGISFHKP